MPLNHGDRMLELIDHDGASDLDNSIRIHRHSDYFHVTAMIQDARVNIPFWITETLLSVIEAKDRHCRITKERLL